MKSSPQSTNRSILSTGKGWLLLWSKAALVELMATVVLHVETGLYSTWSSLSPVHLAVCQGLATTVTAGPLARIAGTSASAAYGHLKFLHTFALKIAGVLAQDCVKDAN